MGRTKKRHRAWKQQMRSRARKRRDWGFSWGDISPGRLVAWAEPAARTRRIERSEPKTYIDVTSEEVREMQKLNRKVDLVGQAITALVITVGALVLVYSIVRWLCGF